MSDSPLVTETTSDNNKEKNQNYENQMDTSTEQQSNLLSSNQNRNSLNLDGNGQPYTYFRTETPPNKSIFCYQPAYTTVPRDQVIVFKIVFEKKQPRMDKMKFINNKSWYKVTNKIDRNLDNHYDDIKEFFYQYISDHKLKNDFEVPVYLDKNFIKLYYKAAPVDRFQVNGRHCLDLRAKLSKKINAYGEIYKGRVKAIQTKKERREAEKREREKSAENAMEIYQPSSSDSDLEEEFDFHQFKTDKNKYLPTSKNISKSKTEEKEKQQVTASKTQQKTNDNLFKSSKNDKIQLDGKQTAKPLVYVSYEPPDAKDDLYNPLNNTYTEGYRTPKNTKRHNNLHRNVLTRSATSLKKRSLDDDSYSNDGSPNKSIKNSETTQLIGDLKLDSPLVNKELNKENI